MQYYMSYTNFQYLRDKCQHIMVAIACSMTFPLIRSFELQVVKCVVCGTKVCVDIACTARAENEILSRVKAP